MAETYGSEKSLVMGTELKVLTFRAYFKQTVSESLSRYVFVRHVIIHYYLNDETISVVAQNSKNSFMPEDNIISRQRLQKNEQGDIWHWRDLNLGVNVVFCGKNFHITNCDKFTKDFMEDNGIILNSPDPVDPYIINRSTQSAALQQHRLPCSSDKLGHSHYLDGAVLRFYCVRGDRDGLFGDTMRMLLLFYLVDDTLEVREIHTQDSSSILIVRQKMRRHFPPSFPSTTMNPAEDDFLTPKDFQIAKTVVIGDLHLYVYNCDNFTKGFYCHDFLITNSKCNDEKPSKRMADESSDDNQRNPDKKSRNWKRNWKQKWRRKLRKAFKKPQLVLNIHNALSSEPSNEEESTATTTLT